MTYQEELTKAMTWLGQQPDTVFLGQCVTYPGNAMFKTLSGVPIEKRIELPVFEDCQLGISIGMALTGKTVISIYPRFDFLILAMNQLVNHLDKLQDFTNNQFKARVIIRVGIGSKSPLYPGVQHCGDYTEAFRGLLRKVRVIRMGKAENILETYYMAYFAAEEGDNSLIVEDMNLYAR